MVIQSPSTGRIRNTAMGKIAEKAVCGSVFLTTWHCILIAELTKNALLHCYFFGDFAEETDLYLRFTGARTQHPNTGAKYGKGCFRPFI